jgi:hypothetical protein
MASITSLSAAEVRELFSKETIFYVEDPTVGERVQDMKKKGMLLETSDGLDFCKRNVFDDTRIRHILGAMFPWSSLGIYEVYTTTESTLVYAFMTGLEPLNALVIQLWSPNAEMVYFKGSHLLQIGGFDSANGLLEIIPAPLRQAGCVPTSVNTKKGGLAVFDARLAFRITSGYAIHFVFATREEIQTWPKKKFPAGEDLERKAAEMENETMGVNFMFGDQ